MSTLNSNIKDRLKEINVFVQQSSLLKLRRYQLDVATAVAKSVIGRLGLSFVVVFPRQSGKNELQAQIETYLLTIYSPLDAEMVKVSPTWKPQTLNAMRRLERVLKRNLLTRDLWKKESGYIYRVRSARIFFLSGGPQAHVVGATASHLLECDEAQDVSIAKWDKDFLPMAASTNATRLYWGTMWTSQTLLARELRVARLAQETDGIRRTFVIDADDVAAEVPAYGKFVGEQVARLGRQHPIIKSQFFSEEIDVECGMFDGRRLGLMQGTHPYLYAPDAVPGKQYALLIDVAGEDEAILEGESGAWATAFRGERLANPERDSTALTVVEVDLSTLSDDLVKAPTYRVVSRLEWIGVRHTTLYRDLRALVELWAPVWVVIDATGVGEGLASFLSAAYPEKVLPFKFNSATKSSLGWSFLAIVETGRFKDWGRTTETALVDKCRTQSELKKIQDRFFEQCAACQMEVIPGPEHRLKWSVPDGLRDPHGEPLHDDLLMSAALCAVLDEQEWFISGAPMLLRRHDPLAELDNKGW